VTSPQIPTAATDADARRLIAQIDARSTHHDAEHQGVRVRWRRFGPDNAAGPPLVLLHGGHGSWMHWLRNVDALSAGRALWVPDMPGFHDSGSPSAPAPGEDSLGPLLAALGGTLDALLGAGTPVDLGGFSFGGFTAARLAVRRGAVRRLALLGSGGHGTPRQATVEMIRWRSAKTPGEEAAALRHNLGALMLHDPAAIDALAYAGYEISCHGTRYRSKAASLAGNLPALLDALDMPQLLLWGEHDVTAVPRPLVAKLVAGHSLREGVVIDGAGHWVQYERADEVNAQLLRFFGAP
jgi:pimeloyl-ACP methyl ester carboxylesterase